MVVLLICLKNFLAARRACYLLYASERNNKVLLSSPDPQELFQTLLAYSCLRNEGRYLLLENCLSVHLLSSFTC